MSRGDRLWALVVFALVALTLVMRALDWAAVVPEQKVFEEGRWLLPSEAYRAIYGLDERTQLVMRDGTAWRYRGGRMVLEERGRPEEDAPTPTPVEVAP